MRLCVKPSWTFAILATSLLEIANYNVAYCIMFYVLMLPSRANNTSVLESLFPANHDERPELHQGSEDGHCEG